jgi:hypothetical protein
MTPEERFWLRVDKSGECWIWTGPRHVRGYGHVRYNGKASRAHRVAWAIANGPVPKGMAVCHRCDNPPCVRPEHLWVGTQAENLADMRAKGRMANRPKVAALPDEELASLLRSLYESSPAMSMRVIGRELGVSKGTVSRWFGVLGITPRYVGYVGRGHAL